MEHGLKGIAFYVQKHIAPHVVYYNFPVVRDKLLGAPASVRLVYSNHYCMRNLCPKFNGDLAHIEVMTFLSNYIP